MQQPTQSPSNSNPNLTNTKSSSKSQKVFWLRNLVRSVSNRSQSNYDQDDTNKNQHSQKQPFKSLSSAPLLHNSFSSPTPHTKSSKTNLVEIKSRPSDQDHARRKMADTLNPSAFDDLPPPELYDPSWNTLPLRCEAGVLGKLSSQDDGTQPKGPILPMAFTLNSSDLEDDSEEDEDYEQDGVRDDDEEKQIEKDLNTSMDKNTIIVTSESTTGDQQSEKTDNELQTPQQRFSLRSDHSLHSLRTLDESSPTNSTITPTDGFSPNAVRKALWKRKGTSGNHRTTHKSKWTQFHYSNDLSTVVEDIGILIEEEYGGEIINMKNGEMRTKIPITCQDAENTYQVVFNVEEQRTNGSGCTVSVRRSFGDTFRLGNEEFEWFCENFANRLKQLRQFESIASQSTNNN